MSILKAKNVQIGNDLVANNNFTLYQPPVPDGTMRIAIGNPEGVKTDIMSWSNTGVITVTSGVFSVTGNTQFERINNTPIGQTTPAAGAFTSLLSTANTTIGNTSNDVLTINGSSIVLANTATISGNANFTGTLGGIGLANYLASPPAIGGTSANNGTFLVLAGTNLSYTGTLTGGTGVIAIGTNQIYKDTSGNVGIGTTVPVLGKLNVTTGFAATDTSARSLAFFSSLDTPTPGSAPSGLYLEYTGSATLANRKVDIRSANFGSGTNGALSFNSGAVFLNSSGNLGIGTATPGSKLGIAWSTNTGIHLSDGTVTGVIYNTGGNSMGIGTTTNHPMVFYTNNAERMRITSSGDVGIGTNVPSSVIHAFRAGATEVAFKATNGTSDWIFGNLSSGKGTIYGPQAQPFGIWTNNIERFTISSSGVVTVGSNPASPAVSLDPTTANALVVNSSGNVGIGTASPTAKMHVVGTLPAGGIYVENNNLSNSSPVVRVRGGRNDGNGSQTFSGGLVLERYSDASQITNGNALGTIYFGGNYSGSSFGYPASISAVASANWSSTTTANTDLVFLTGSTAQTALGVANVAYGTERARITSAGNLLVGDTSVSDFRIVAGRADNQGLCVLKNTLASGLTYDQLQINITNAASPGFFFQRVYAGGAPQFGVRGDGTIYAQNTTVQSISDIRIKENIRSAEVGLPTVLGLRPVRFDFKEGFGNNRKNQLGFIAQEVEAVFPEAVDKAIEKDENGDNYKSVGPSALIPLLVKAIQELHAENQFLRSEIEALKARLP
jgi:hypothetical protein